MSRVRLGLALPSFVDDPEIPIAVARRAEAAGLDGVFVYDHVWRDIPPPRRGALECFALLGAIAAETRHIAVGTLVARASLRPASTLAIGFDTVHRISAGRLVAGIGAGDRESRAENEAFGLEFGDVATRVTELMEAVQTAHGRGFPVWVGGKSRIVRETVALADGWNGWSGTPDDLRDNAALVRAVAPDAAITWAGLALLGRDDEHAAAKAAGRRVGPATIAGGPATAAARIGEYAAAGAEWVILAPIDSGDAENATILGEEIAPRLEASPGAR